MRPAFSVLLGGLALKFAAFTPAFSQTGVEAGPEALVSTPADDVALIPADKAGGLPLVQRMRIQVLSGGVRGVGMLAEYAKGGPDRIIVARKTVIPDAQPWEPAAHMRIFNPDGNLVAIESFSGQQTGVAIHEIRLPTDAPASAGIWRVSFTGGRQGDMVEFRLPATDTWGVRGEMALGVTKTTPRSAFLWLPDSAVTLLVGIEAGDPAGLELRDGAGRLVATPAPDPVKRPARLLWEKPSPDTICQVKIPETFTAAGALVIEGAPGLLCPDPEAARRLRGGAIKSHGLWTAGPLQARARDWMVRNVHKIHPDIVTAWHMPDRIPATLAASDRELARQALAFGKYYAPLNNLEHMLRLQNENLDPASPFFGWTWTSPAARLTPNWTHFLPTDKASVRIPSALAAAWAFRSPLNPAGGTDELLTRATFSALSNIVSLQGDDLVRERTLIETRYPMTHVFFVYMELAETLQLLKTNPGLPSDAEALWREAVMAVGDKLADFRAYMSNQWLHIILAHLQVYHVTREPRFLGYFEHQMRAFLAAGRDAPDSKFGQHPAGFYLENYGPDGNYDAVNAAYMAACYHIYRELPAASPEIVSTMREAIGKNLRLRSFFWLPQPGGGVVSPGSVNTRKTIPFAHAIWGTDHITRAEFPLAAARAALSRQPRQGVGNDATNASYIANNPDWIRKVVEQGLARGYGAWKFNYGNLFPHLFKAYDLPQTAAPARLPFEESDRIWQLPGLRAWKGSDLYGVVFYDVEGATRRLDNFMGGGPTVLWTRELGSFINGGAPFAPSATARITRPEDLLFSCIYGRDASGRFFHTGKERSTSTDPGTGAAAAGATVTFAINAKLDNPFGNLVWQYSQTGDILTIIIRLRAVEPIREVFLNLPLVARDGATLETSASNRILFRPKDPAGKSVIIEWPANHSGQLASSRHQSIQRLVIALPGDGGELPVKITTAR